MTPLRVLVVDDEPIVVAEARAALKAMGHTVCATAATERAAIGAARVHRPDLVIVSAQLRIGDGIAAIEHICSERPVAHILLAPNRALLIGRKPDSIVVQKPFTARELETAVQRAGTCRS